MLKSSFFAALGLAVAMSSTPPCELSEWYEGVTCPTCNRTTVTPTAADNAKPQHEVAQTVQRYFDGLDRGDTSLLRQAFHPAAVLYFVRNDSLVALTQPAWFARMRPRDAAAPPAGT